MRRIELKIFNGQFASRNVLLRLKRKLLRQTEMGECLLLDFEEVRGLADEDIKYLTNGLAFEKYRILGAAGFRPFPLSL